MRHFFTKAIVCAGVVASALALNGMAVWAAEAVTKVYTFGTSNASLSTDTKDFFTIEIPEGKETSNYATLAKDSKFEFTIPDEATVQSIVVTATANHKNTQNVKLTNKVADGQNGTTKAPATLDSNGNALETQPDPVEITFASNKYSDGLNTITGAASINYYKIEVTYTPLDESEGIQVPYTGEYANFQNSGKSSNAFYTTTGGGSKTPGNTVVVKGRSFTNGFKLNTGASVSFTTENTGSLYLVMFGADSDVKVDGIEYTATDNLIQVNSLAAGDHTVEKISSEVHLAYIEFVGSGETTTVSDTYTDNEITFNGTVTTSDNKTIDAPVAYYGTNGKHYLLIGLSAAQTAYDKVTIGNVEISKAYTSITFGENDSVSASDLGSAAIAVIELDAAPEKTTSNVAIAFTLDEA